MSEKLNTSETRIDNSDKARRKVAAENLKRALKMATAAKGPIEIKEELNALEANAEKARETVITTVEQADQYIKRIISDLHTEGAQQVGNLEPFIDDSSEHQDPRPNAIGFTVHLDHPDGAFIDVRIGAKHAIPSLDKPSYEFTSISFMIPEKTVDNRSILHPRGKSIIPLEVYSAYRQKSNDDEVTFGMNSVGHRSPHEPDEMTPDDKKEAESWFIDLAEKVRQLADKKT